LCGIVGAHFKETAPVALSIYYALYALQHRGQESAGITVYDGTGLRTVKDMGEIPEVFKKEVQNYKPTYQYGETRYQSKSNGGFMKLKCNVGIGHVRYSTTGGSKYENCQPLEDSGRRIAIAHNGNLVNSKELTSELEKEGRIFYSDSDTEVILHLLIKEIMHHGQDKLEYAAKELIKRLNGSYSLVILLDNKLLAIRDPLGIKPLCFGEINNYLFSWDEIIGNDKRLIEFLKQNYDIDWLEKSKIEKIDDDRTIIVSNEKNSLSLRLDNEKNRVNLKIDDGRTGEFVAKIENGKQNIYNYGFVVASESVAIDTLNGKFIRDVMPGEMLIFSNGTYKSSRLTSLRYRAHCVFEYIYFARPDSVIDGKLVYDVRMRIGEELFKEHPIRADIVTPVPDSGITYAIGFSKKSKITYMEGLMKNRYIGRTFIMPWQEMRETAVRLKLNTIKPNIEGKSIALIDDSIVRGTTSRRIIELIRKSSAKEVHMRIASPPLKSPCYLGIDMATREELVAAHKTVEGIEALINADSLGYISKEGLIKSIGIPEDDLCLGCLTGIYPVKIPGEQWVRQKKLDEFYEKIKKRELILTIEA
jgi:glutamine phosphoribosylpyrophosphate amidotransferase